MNEIRYASLSGTLLARKGAAKPAMRPRPLSTGQMLDDLGWDDMGGPLDEPTEHYPSSIAGLTPAPKAPVAPDEPAPVLAQQQALASHFGQSEPEDEEPDAPEIHEVAPAEPEAWEEQPAPPEARAEEPAAPEPREEQRILSEAVVSALRAPAQPDEKPKAERKSESRPEPKAKREKGGDPILFGRKAAFTLRLDADRHLQLRLASAVTRSSSQQLVTQALDQFLSTLPELAALAQQLPARAGKKS